MKLIVINSINLLSVFIINVYILKIEELAVSDVYLFVFSISQFFIIIFGGVFSRIIFPLLHKDFNAQNVNSILLLLVFNIIIITIVFVVLDISAKGYYISRFSSISKETVMYLFYGFLIITVLSTCQLFFTAINNSLNYFFLVDSIIFISNGVVITGMLFGCITNYKILLLFLISRLVFITILSYRVFHKKVSFSSGFSTGFLLLVLKKAKYLFLSSLYYKTSGVFDKSIILYFYQQGGMLSTYHVATQLMDAVNTIINRSLIVTKTRFIIDAFKENDVGKIEVILMKIFWISVLAVTGILLVTKMSIFDIFYITLFSHINIGVENIGFFKEVLLSLFGLVFAGILGNFYTQTFYSKGKVKLPSLVGMFGYTMFIPIKILAVYYYGLIGLALASSSYYLFNLMLLHFFYKKYILRV